MNERDIGMGFIQEDGMALFSVRFSALLLCPIRNEVVNLSVNGMSQVNLSFSLFPSYLSRKIKSFLKTS